MAKKSNPNKPAESDTPPNPNEPAESDTPPNPNEPAESDTPPNPNEPAENDIRPKAQREHKATYASDKHNPGQYNIRIIGPNAPKFKPGQKVPVTRKDDSESIETLGKCIWAGTDEETKRPVALYHFASKPREKLDDEIPF